MSKWYNVVAAGLLASACVSTAPNPDADIRQQAWQQINHITELTDLGNNRLRLKAEAAPGYNVEMLEVDLLARASGEALRRGADRFAIVYVEYDANGLGEVFSSGIYNDGTRRWIGAYEDLIAARNENDPSGTLSGGFRFKEMRAVVRLLAAGEETSRPSFSAQETYDALLEDRIKRRNIQPTKHLNLWPF